MGCKYLCHANKRSLLLQLFIKYPPSTQGVAYAATQDFKLSKSNIKMLLNHNYIKYTVISRRILERFRVNYNCFKPLVLKYTVK